MKKLLSIIMALTIVLSLPFSVSAADTTPEEKNTAFEISLDDLIRGVYENEYNYSYQDGKLVVSAVLDINSDVYTEIVLYLDANTKANSKSFSMEGWFRLTSNQEIVSVYGLDGTFEYNGTKANSTGSSGYHNSTMSGWTGSYNISTSQSNTGTASITGNYTLRHNGTVNNTAYCTAKCTKSGSISFSGNYDESSVF